MNKNTPLEKYVLLYIPWGLALLFRSEPILSYMIAYLGSILIFIMTLSGWLRPLPNDRPVAAQLMRPIFLVQIIFAGYMCSTSIFYFLNALGYDNFHPPVTQYDLIDYQKLEIVAQCQRYYVLGHAAFITGIVVFMKYPSKQKFYVAPEKLANLLLVTAVITLPVAFLFLKLPGLSQFYFQLSSLSFIAGTLALAFAIPQKKATNTVFCVILYAINFYQALVSGFKEPIILSVLVLGVFLYPSYKKVVIITFVPALSVLFFFLPSYNAAFRQSNWGDDVNADEAYHLALDAALENDQSGDNSNWNFCVYRLSEIDMFTTFVESTPSTINFYGFDLLKQSAIAVVPRAFWPSKPSTEDLVMQRVYNAGVIRRGSNVSAKPAYITDAYLSGGTFGVFIGLLLYGMAVQVISLRAERLFGGYVLGTALIFSGLFQIFWRGLSFEFLINSVFWSYVTMLLIFWILRRIKILKEV
jgi:hypothetical protein